MEERFKEYLREQDRAVTPSEFLNHTSVKDTNDNYLELKDLIKKLEEKGFVSTDVKISNVSMETTVRVYPTNKLFSE